MQSEIVFFKVGETVLVGDISTFDLSKPFSIIPPDLDEPSWEIQYKDYTLRTDGRVIVIAREEEIEKQGEGEKVTRIKRGVSRDAVLENKE